uniref:Deoxyuridine 5'-triphosphate nucleotidohydrolase n=1 Tax=Tetranychus urticae TaxID=32264 RepID=T1JX02_TETUR
MISALYFTKCYPDVTTPERATARSIGFDLSSYEDLILPPQKIAVVKTGITVKPPDGTYVRLASRSGLASKGIVVQGGVIDPDYTGEIKVILQNFSENNLIIKKGMRIAQMIIEKAEIPHLVELAKLPSTPLEEHVDNRGERGFGSSGI